MHHRIVCVCVLVLLAMTACAKPSDPTSRINDCKQYATDLLSESLGLSKPPKLRWVLVEQQQESGVQIQVVLGFRLQGTDDQQDDGGTMNNLVCQYPYIPPINGGEEEYETSPYGVVFNNQMIEIAR